MDQPLRAAIYARVSTPTQKSSSVQISECLDLLSRRGWKRCFQLVDDGEKGRDPDRPGYRRILELASSRRIDVVVWNLDRLFRSLKEASSAQEALAEHDVSIVSITEPFDTTSTIGRFVFGFLANVAQFETDMIRERSQLGYARRVKEGKWTGAHVPYGFCRKPDGTLAIHEAEAAVVRRMVRQYHQLEGDDALAAWLRRCGILRRNRPWTTRQVRT